MSNWKPGMKARCIKSYSHWPIREGYTDDVVALHSCCRQWISLKNAYDPGTSSGFCNRCGAPYWGEDLMFPSDCFVPAEPLKEEMDRIESEGAPVELETVEA